MDSISNDDLKNPELNVDREMASLIQQSRAPNTLKAYQHALKRFHTWLDANGLNPDHLTDKIVAKYIAALYTTGKTPSTIAIVVAAIKWSAADSEGGNVVGELTNKILAGIRRTGRERGRRQVGGLTWPDVEQVCKLAEEDNTIAGLRDSALIRLMSDCLLRISEAVAVNVKDLGENALTVRRSKEDQEGNGETLFVGVPTMEAIKKYRETGNIEEGALFRRVRRGGHVTRDRLGVEGARIVIKVRARAAGVEGFISGHSLRVGSAVSLAKAGASVVDMQAAGRWKSPQMPAHYARAELVEQGGIARFKYNDAHVKRKCKAQKET